MFPLYFLLAVYFGVAAWVAWNLRVTADQPQQVYVMTLLQVAMPLLWPIWTPIAFVQNLLKQRQDG